MKFWFQAFAFKFILYRYTVVVTQNLEQIIQAADKVTPGKVYWKETSPLVGEVPRRPHVIDNKAKQICGAKGQEGPCTYVTFPNFPQRLHTGGNLQRWDAMHFANVATYKCWNRAVLEAGPCTSRIQL